MGIAAGRDEATGLVSCRKKEVVFFFLRALQAPSSTSPGQGREQLSARGQRAARRHPCGNSSPYSGRGSARSSNHSQHSQHSRIHRYNTQKSLFASLQYRVALCTLPPPISPAPKGRKNKNQSGGFSWIKRAKSRAVTAGAVFPKHHECLDHTRHFQRGMGGTHIPANDGNGRGVPRSASLLPPRRTGFPTSRQGCQEHEGRRLQGRREAF